jgi:Mlc titration factor MtfA (ptsG expression regulator)
MPLTKSTLDDLNAYITDANGALSKGETDVVAQINALKSGGDISQVDLVKLQWSISRYSITASVFGNIMKEFADSLKQGANRLS